MNAAPATLIALTAEPTTTLAPTYPTPAPTANFPFGDKESYWSFRLCALAPAAAGLTATEQQRNKKIQRLRDGVSIILLLTDKDGVYEYVLRPLE